jgi:hypothetical protein
MEICGRLRPWTRASERAAAASKRADSKAAEEAIMTHSDEWQRKATAHHEAGHAVIRYLLNFELKPTTVANTSNEQPLRGIKLDTDGSDRARLRLEKAIRISFAGPLSEEKFSNHHWNPSHGEYDYAKILELALRACGSNQAEAFTRWLRIATQEMIDANWAAIEQVADQLLAHERLTGATISAVIRAAG